MENVLVNKTDLEKLLEYNREAEKADYENATKEERKGHIYQTIKRLDKQKKG